MQDVTMPHKENRVILCFSFYLVPEEVVRSANAALEGKFPIGLYSS